MNSNKYEWWKTAVIYQIYPRSFADTTQNGIGDIRGVINHFDYLTSLNIDAIWFSPFFLSPQKDFGYDVANFREIDPVFGTMQDFKELLDLAHEYNIKILLDFVPNHTSDQHRWFKESRRSRTNNYRDYYIWQDGRGKKPPNNWKSDFGGSAWSYDNHTHQWYYHHFLPSQPDLNYRNPAVKQAMFDNMRFWLDKGVDGFRLDVIHCVYEDPKLRNNPRSWRLVPSDHSTAYLFQDHVYDKNQPETFEFVHEMRTIVDKYNDRVLLGEVLGPVADVRSYYGSIRENTNTGLHLVFNFTFTAAAKGFNAAKLAKKLKEINQSLPNPLWPCYVLSNHDRPRMISRHGNDVRKAKLLALLQLTLRGTPVIYMGEEIGMEETPIPRKKIQDPVGKIFWFSPFPIGRDGCRTPMQWSKKPNAGFSDCDVGKTWLPVNKNYVNINVESCEANPSSILHFYRSLLEFRRKNPILLQGNFVLQSTQQNVLNYIRQENDQEIIIILNLNKHKTKLREYLKGKQIVFSTYYPFIRFDKTSEISTLRPFEGIIAN